MSSSQKEIQSTDGRKFAALSILTAIACLVMFASCSPETGLTISGTPGEVLSPAEKASLSYDLVNMNVFKKGDCARCHNKFADYDGIVANIGMIKKKVLVEKSMPPKRVATLSSKDLAYLQEWIRKGMPREVGGKPAMPPTPTPPPTATPEPTPSSTPDPQATPSPTPVPTAAPTPIPLQPTFASIRTNILAIRCDGCHSGDGFAAWIPLKTVNDLAKSPVGPLFVAGQPDQSKIVDLISRTDDKRMPEPPKPPLDADQIQVIRQWIQNGAID